MWWVGEITEMSSKGESGDSSTTQARNAAEVSKIRGDIYFERE